MRPRARSQASSSTCQRAIRRSCQCVWGVADAAIFFRPRSSPSAGRRSAARSVAADRCGAQVGKGVREARGPACVEKQVRDPHLRHATMKIEDRPVGSGRGDGLEAIRAQPTARGRTAGQQAIPGSAIDAVHRLIQGDPAAAGPFCGVQGHGKTGCAFDSGGWDEIAFGLAMAMAVGQPDVARTQGVTKGEQDRRLPGAGVGWVSAGRQAPAPRAPRANPRGRIPDGAMRAFRFMARNARVAVMSGAAARPPCNSSASSMRGA